MTFSIKFFNEFIPANHEALSLQHYHYYHHKKNVYSTIILYYNLEIIFSELELEIELEFIFSKFQNYLTFLIVLELVLTKIIMFELEQHYCKHWSRFLDVEIVMKLMLNTGLQWIRKGPGY